MLSRPAYDVKHKRLAFMRARAKNILYRSFKPSKAQIILIVVAAAMLGIYVVYRSLAATAVCTQTISTGANVASIAGSAAPGSVICLNNGNYGSVNFNNITKTSDVTLQSASGKGLPLHLSLMTPHT